MNDPNKQKDQPQNTPQDSSDAKIEEQPGKTNPAHWNFRGNIIIEDNDGDPDISE